MLQYSEQYNIANGIFLAFHGKSKVRLLSVKHPHKKLDNMKSRFPFTKYEQFTKENFIVTCLYVMFRFSPSSVDDVLKHLQEINFKKEVEPFKVKIMTYRALLTSHIEYLIINYGKPTIKDIFDAYREKKLEFYTIWFYLYYLGYDLYIEIDTKVFSRVQVIELKKIKNLLLYVTFSESSLEHIKLLLTQSDLVQEEI